MAFTNGGPAGVLPGAERAITVLDTNAGVRAQAFYRLRAE